MLFYFSEKVINLPVFVSNRHLLVRKALCLLFLYQVNIVSIHFFPTTEHDDTKALGSAV